MNSHIIIDKITHDTFYSHIKTLFASKQWCVIPPEEYIYCDLNKVYIYTEWITEFMKNKVNKKYNFQELCEFLIEVITNELKGCPPEKKHQIIFENKEKNRIEYTY